MNTSCQRLAAIGVLMGAVFGPASAYADAWDDFLTHTYIGIGGGVNLAGEADTSGPGFAGEAEYELGWAAAGTFGYRTDFGLRTELEVSRRVNDVDTFAGIGTGGIRFAGQIHAAAPQRPPRIRPLRGSRALS